MDLRTALRLRALLVERAMVIALGRADQVFEGGAERLPADELRSLVRELARTMQQVVGQFDPSRQRFDRAASLAADYAIAKIAGIKLCEALRAQHGFDAISLMPTNLYGPGDNYHPTNSHVLPALIRRFHEAAERGDASVTCWGTGTPLREFLHVDDLGEACVFALEHWDPASAAAPRADDGQPLAFLNVGTGLDLSIRELAEAVAAATGFSGEIAWDTSQPDGTPKKQLDVSRLAALGWRARIPLAEGLASTVEAFRQQLGQQALRL